jgi:hypothetical protein
VKNFKGGDDEDSTKKSIMLISNDGEKKKTVAVDVDKILKIEKSNKNLLNVLYFKQGKLINARYSLNNFDIVSEPAIFDLKNTNLKNSNLIEGE